MATPFESFVVTELPRRPTLLTYENTSYAGDPNSGGAPSIIQNSPKGSLFLQSSTGIMWRKSTSGATSWVFDANVPVMIPNTIWAATSTGSKNCRVPVGSPLLSYMPPGFIPNVSIIPGIVVALGFDSAISVALIEPVFCALYSAWPNLGTIQILKDAVVIASFDMTAYLVANPSVTLPYVGSTATITSSPWSIALARNGSAVVLTPTYSFTPTGGDLNTRSLKYRISSGDGPTLSVTNVVGVAKTVTFVTPLAYSMDTTVLKYLSGIAAIAYGSKGRIQGELAAWIGPVWSDMNYTNLWPVWTYSPQSLFPQQRIFTAPSSLSMTDTMLINAVVDFTNQTICTATPQLGVYAVDRGNSPSIGSGSFSATRVHTFPVSSTSRREFFLDEVRRIVLGSGTYSGDATPWNGTAALVNGNAQIASKNVSAPNGMMISGANSSYGDYPSFTGNQQYERFISAPNTSRGVLYLTTSGSAYNRYGLGRLNIFIHLTNEGKYFDTFLLIGQVNGTGDGSSPANSIGCRSSNALYPDVVTSNSTHYPVWDISPYSTATNHDEYRLVIIMRDAVGQITHAEEIGP